MQARNPSQQQSFKKFISDQSELFLETPKNSGIRFSRQLSLNLDAFIAPVFSEFSEIAVYALGSYGRKELCLHSDIDLLFYYDQNNPEVEKEIEKALYALWDLNVPISHKIIHSGELFQAIKDDHQFQTTLLEARLLNDVPVDLANSFQKGSTLGYQLDKEDFFKQKLLEIKERHLKFNQTNRFLEPNLKDGPGGLRDINCAFWLAANIVKLKEFKDLMRFGILSTSTYEKFRDCLSFFLSLRNTLHGLAGRKQEILFFNWQEEVSKKWAYNNKGLAMQGAEKLMTQYYTYAEQVSEILSDFEFMFSPIKRNAFPDSKKQRTLKPYCFSTSNGISCNLKMLFKEPEFILRPFVLSQDNNQNINRSILKQFRELFEEGSQLPKEFPAETYFDLLQIITHLGPDGETLFKLHKNRILGHFIPDFKRLKMHWQMDLYHVYTVDDHTLRAVDYFRRLYRGEMKSKYPYITQIAHSLQQPEILSLALLFHDIGKGLKGDHSILGIDIFKDFAKKASLDRKTIDFVSLLIRHHLILRDTAIKRDLEDPEVTKEFCQNIPNLAFLDALFVLSHCDIINVGPGRFNAWSEQLMIQLHQNSRAYISNNTLPQIHPVNYEPLYPNAFARARSGDFSFYFTPLENQGMGILMVIGPDQTGLLSLISAVLACMGVSILTAEIYLTSDGVAVDKFRINSGKFVGDLVFRMKEIWHQLNSLDSSRRSEKIIQSLKSMLPMRTATPEIEPRVTCIGKTQKENYRLLEIDAN